MESSPAAHRAPQDFSGGFFLKVFKVFNDFKDFKVAMLFLLPPFRNFFAITTNGYC